VQQHIKVCHMDVLTISHDQTCYVHKSMKLAHNSMHIVSWLER